MRDFCLDKKIAVRYNISRIWYGGVSEWFKELVLKTSESARARGFESYLLRLYGPLVKRLRHRPFTAVTGVRFSHGSLILWLSGTVG